MHWPCLCQPGVKHGLFCVCLMDWGYNCSKHQLKKGFSFSFMFSQHVPVNSTSDLLGKIISESLSLCWPTPQRSPGKVTLSGGVSDCYCGCHTFAAASRVKMSGIVRPPLV